MPNNFLFLMIFQLQNQFNLSEEKTAHGQCKEWIEDLLKTLIKTALLKANNNPLETNTTILKMN